MTSSVSQKCQARGLTLIEVVVSLGILMLGLGATATLIVSSLAYSQRNEQAIVVSNLAREGIEVIRVIRDRTDQGFDGVQNGVWSVDGSTSALETPVSVGGIGTANVSLSACTACRLYLVNGRYAKSSGSGIATPYSRAVEVSDINPGVEKKVESVVQWQSHGRTQTFTLEARIYNWR